jgi:hypothetical protein
MKQITTHDKPDVLKHHTSLRIPAQTVSILHHRNGIDLCSLSTSFKHVTAAIQGKLDSLSS